MDFGLSFSAVIFDMDGVIVDSMPYHYDAWNQVFKDLGINISKTELYMREGEKGAFSLDYFTRRAGINLTKEELAENLDKKEAIFKKISKPKVFPLIEDIIHGIKDKGISTGLVTGTSYNEAAKLLPLEIFNSFDVIVAGDMVIKGKPDPEPYLMASKKLGISPEKCLVVENAPNGITSAKGAGMFCIAICTSLEQEYLKEADEIFSNFDDLKNYLLKTNFSTRNS
ncbi:HAD family phosphatase [bacterium]|nr:HAD family phosphatase [bacterium]